MLNFKQIVAQWRHSLSFKSMVKTTLIGVAVLLVFALLSYFSLRGVEESRAHTQVKQLITTVDSTLRIACYLKDKRLATQIAEGLMSNLSVAGVRISVNDTLLAEVKNNYVDFTKAKETLRLPVASVIDSTQYIGMIELIPDNQHINAQASQHALWLVLAFALAFILAIVLSAWALLDNVFKPIRTFVATVHQLNPQAMQRVQVPAMHAEDELGVLAEDVNNLLERAVQSQSKERNLIKQIEQSERKFRALVENSIIGLFEINSAGELISANTAFYTIFNIPEDRKENVQDLNIKHLLHNDATRISKMIDKLNLDRVQQKQEFEVVSRLSKTTTWLQMILEYGDGDQIQGLVHDITENRMRAQETLSMIEKDTLTGAFNRRGMYARLNKLYDAFIEDESMAFSVMAIDLDWFKQVNDTHGHEAGDMVLTIVTRRLESILRDDDTIARVGGDEFILLLPTLQIREWATHLAERIIGSLMSEINLGGGKIVKIGASIGIATSHIKDSSLDMILKRADTAMYNAKRAGKCQMYYLEY